MEQLRNHSKKECEGCSISCSIKDYKIREKCPCRICIVKVVCTQYQNCEPWKKFIKYFWDCRLKGEF